MRKFSKIVVAAALAVSSLGVIVPQAASAAGGCVTRAEFRRVHNGMTLSQVTGIYGTSGQVALRSGSMMIRNYKTCLPYHVSNVSYLSGRVASKLFI